jgi:hypothetical protein
MMKKKNLSWQEKMIFFYQKYKTAYKYVSKTFAIGEGVSLSIQSEE